ncbi:hypothetical protein HHI36_010468 [Cryptolaemus montrouzieri]|uniref:Uncharacterized protein n=1 Tax=Cryptolaemus montrouzieri TaxID=559131 RepID=A0ABD2MIT9_9CUCU
MIKISAIHILLQCLLSLVWCETLEHQNSQNGLNPLLDSEYNAEYNKHQDKRTIFNSGPQNVGWAKHVAVYPSGSRYVIGYGGVNFKYVPVLRPPIKLISHHRRPKWPMKLMKPNHQIRPIHDHGWRPANPIVKPVLVKPVLPISPLVPVLRPVTPIISTVQSPPWPNKSWQANEWKPKPELIKPAAPVTPVQVIPVQPILKPLPAPQLVPVHQVVSFQSIVPIQPAPPVQPLPNPWVPIVKPAISIPQQPIFQVAKPNLPVLPLGASFPTSILQQAPGVFVHKPPLIQQNPQIHLQYHGSHNLAPLNTFINIPKLASIQPQYPTQFIQPIPQQSPDPNPLSNTPFNNILLHFHNGQQTVSVPLQQQHVPGVAHIQQLSFQQQTTGEEYQPPLAHGQLPLEGENEGSQHQQNVFFSSNQQNFASQDQREQQYVDQELQQPPFQSSNSIQPGQTDVQIPLYLPPHAGFNSQVEDLNNPNTQFISPQQNEINNFRPSPALEPPFNTLGFNRREYVEPEIIDKNPKDYNTTHFQA